MADLRFPVAETWLVSTQAGEGVSLMVKQDGITVAFQLRSKVTVDGKVVQVDIRDHGKNLRDAINQGLDSMEKSLALLKSKRKAGLWERLKAWALA